MSCYSLSQLCVEWSTCFCSTVVALPGWLSPTLPKTRLLGNRSWGLQYLWFLSFSTNRPNHVLDFSWVRDLWACGEFTTSSTKGPQCHMASDEFWTSTQIFYQILLSRLLMGSEPFLKWLSRKFWTSGEFWCSPPTSFNEFLSSGESRCPAH